MKKLTIVLGIILSILCVSFLMIGGERYCIMPVGTTLWSLEIADTPEQHAKGLMNRNTLCSTCGMLFIFSDEQPRTFWMKNTYIPLDIYFYNGDGHLIDGIANMLPDTGIPMRYTARSAKYVIELHAGSFFPIGKLDLTGCR